MKTLELNKMGLAPMEQIEMQGVEGGGFLKYLWEAAKALVTEEALRAAYTQVANAKPSSVPDSARNGCAMSPVRVY